MTTIHVSIIVTAHSEGRLIHRTLRSINRSVVFAESQGICCETIIVADNPDEKTGDYLNRTNSAWPSRLSIHRVDFRDPGLARNYGAELASGAYIAFLDGDDLYGEQWIAKAYKNAQTDDGKAVYYPEIVVVFEQQNLIAQFPGTQDKAFKFSNLIEYNGWGFSPFLPKEIFLNTPFVQTVSASGFGYEDWHWYCEVLASGYEVIIVPETCIYYRRKASNSRLLEHNYLSTTLPKAKLFDPSVFVEFIDRDNRKKESVADGKRDEFAPKSYLRRCTDVIFEAFPGLYPWLVSKGVLGSNVKQDNQIPELPSWLLSDWKSTNNVEPQVYPDSITLKSLSVYSVPSSRIALPYLELVNFYGDDVSHVFFVPWLKRGGSDLVTINFVRALTESGMTGRIVVISDMDADSPWATRLPQQVRFIELGRTYNYLTTDEKEKILVRLLVQMEPKVIHNINSDLCYRILVKYGKALSQRSKIFVSTFCAEYTEEGKIAGYPFVYFPDCIDYVDTIIFENDHFRQQLINTFAFDQDKMLLVYTPYDVCPTNRVESDTVNLDILWAGRFDVQKRPDVLIEIARRTLNKPYKYHVYGGSLLSDDVYTDELAKLKNVVLYGVFDGLKSLPIEKYDLLLFTSGWEGIPTILLDAMSRKLPVIASSVGGIGEILENEVSGLLVDPYDDVDKFIDMLDLVYSNRVVLSDIADKAYNFIQKKRSWGQFLSEVYRIPGYLQK